MTGIKAPNATSVTSRDGEIRPDNDHLNRTWSTTKRGGPARMIARESGFSPEFWWGTATSAY